jgi:hypothetical protein
MTERRYSEDEVGAIFEKAAEAQLNARRALPSGEGLTLAGLQEIGREIGIPPELVERAARSLDHGGVTHTRRLLGLPIGVGRAVDLGRKLTDGEWERLVVKVRETFDATGKVESNGAFRQWSNGNLQVLVEPTATGHQVRMKTVNSGSQALIGMGGFLVAMTGFVALAQAMAGKLGAGKSLAGIVFLGGMGLAGIVWGSLITPAWARLRRKQMEQLAQDLTTTTE